MKRGRGRNGRNKPSNNLNRTLESNGPDVKVRGTAHQICDKYLALARDAHASGDRIASENYLQHAEHYHRIILSAQPAGQEAQHQPRDQDDEDENTVAAPSTTTTADEAESIEAADAADASDDDDANEAPRRARRGRRSRSGRSGGKANGASEGGAAGDAEAAEA